MNKEWSDRNKQMQALLKKNTFAEGIQALLSLRQTLMEEIRSWKALPREDFSAIPYLNADGYHSKTVAYSLWHIFRIEDIVVQSLIRQEQQVLFSGGYADAVGSPIITTGNELQGMEIAAFSRQLDIDALYAYIEAVKQSTDDWLMTLDASVLTKKFTEADRARLERLGTVSASESAAWLLDYWCSKDVRGLMKMPLSRHWIMHTEASLRILHGVHKK